MIVLEEFSSQQVEYDESLLSKTFNKVSIDLRLGQEKDFNDPEISKIYTDVYEASNKERGKKYSAKISKSLEYYDFFFIEIIFHKPIRINNSINEFYD